MDPLWDISIGDGPILATGIHDGHELRPEVVDVMNLGEADRLREEDPHTGAIASVVPSWIVPRRSRFEVDLNRPRPKSVYIEPEDAWGLELWASKPSQELIQESLGIYDDFYRLLRETLDALAAAHGRFIVLDIHSYNHQRGGPGAELDDAAANPQVNVGTGSLDRNRWGHIVDRFMTELAGPDGGGGQLDVRENVRFRGGHMASWIHANYPESGCALAIEFKKTFMDEWSGRLEGDAFCTLRTALRKTLPGLVEALGTA